MALPSFRDLNRTRVGVVCLIAIALGLVATFAVGTLGVLENRYDASVVLSDTAGLRAGAKVRMAGVVIGEITSVEPDFDTGQVVVGFEINSDVPLGTEMTAEVAIGTLLGGQYLRLDGSVAPDGQGRQLADLPVEERRIPLDRSQVPYTIIEALSVATNAIGALDVDKVNAAVRALAELTTRDADDISALVQNLNIVASAIVERDQDLRRLVTNAQQVSATLAARDQQLVALVDSADVLLTQIAARRDELATLLGSGNRAVTALADLIDSQRANLDNILADLHVTLDRVDANLDVVNTGLAWAGPTFSALSEARGQGPWFDIVVEGLGPVSTDIITGLVGTLLEGTPLGNLIPNLEEVLGPELLELIYGTLGGLGL